MQGREGPGAAEVGRVWLFVLAITIHNLPEVDLSGLVRTDIERKAIHVAAETAAGVRAVNDNLTIRPVGYGEWDDNSRHVWHSPDGKRSNGASENCQITSTGTPREDANWDGPQSSARPRLNTTKRSFVRDSR